MEIDYIRFVNSNAIGDYLYRIKYDLSDVQKLYLIVNNFHVSLDEKIFALKRLKTEAEELFHDPLYDDASFSLTSGLGVPGYIKLYLHDLEKKRAFLTENDPDYFFSLSYLKYHGDEYNFAGCFKTFESAYDGIKRILLNKDGVIPFRESADIRYFSIRKQRFGEKEEDGTLFYSRDLRLCELAVDIAKHPELKLDDPDPDELCIYLPMPFKRGDIVRMNECPCTPVNKALRYSVFNEYRPLSMALDDLKHGKEGIIYYGYYSEEDDFSSSVPGEVFSYNLDSVPDYMVNTHDKSLLLLSRLIKGDLEPDLFYKAMNVYENERAIKRIPDRQFVFHR